MTRNPEKSFEMSGTAEKVAEQLGGEWGDLEELVVIEALEFLGHDGGDFVGLASAEAG